MRMQSRNRHHLPAWLGALALMACSASALALEADQVRGEIVDVRPTQNRLQLEVSEAGADRTAREGRRETYELDEGTEIRLENARESLLDPQPMTLDDLEAGAMVLLDFEELDGRRVARNVCVENGSGDSSVADSRDADRSGSDDAAAGSGGASEMAAMESDDRRNSLPSTASALPLMAAFGTVFAGTAVLLRIRRRR